MHRNRSLLLFVVVLLVGAGLFSIWRVIPADAPQPMPTLAVLPTGAPTSEPVAVAAVDDRSVDRDAAQQQAGAAVPAVADSARAVPDRVIVTFSPDATDAQRRDYITRSNAQHVRELPELNTVVLDLPPDATLPDADYVATQEPDYYVAALATTSDTHIDRQWALGVMNVAAGWAAVPDNAAPQTVAVIDSGVCLDHPDLQGRILRGYDFVDDDDLPQDEFNHGCGVAGIIAANIDNAAGIAGIVPDVRILPLRVLDAQGSGTYSDVARAIVQAADSGATVINLSLGGYVDSGVMSAAVDYALARDIDVIAAAGNTASTTITVPARIAGVVAVGAVDRGLQQASFSSYGAGVSLWAPGDDIFTTSGDDYATFSGTSYAAPQVAGVAALERMIGRRLTVDGGVVRLQPDDAEPSDTPTPPVPAEEEPTGLWVVDVVPGTDAVALAQRLGFEYVRSLQPLDTLHLFSLPATAQLEEAAVNAANVLAASARVVEYEQQIRREYQTRQLPTDPNFAAQWHLNNTGQSGGTAGNDARVINAWNTGYTGTGVQVAVVDDGLQHTHPDIAPNYDATGSADILTGDGDPSPGGPDNGHGTAAAGVAAAAADGSTCGVGAAYDASLAGIRLIDGAIYDTQIADALLHAYQLNDVYNNSWGPFDDGSALGGPGVAARNALVEGVVNGRGGLGNVYVFAAGNGYQYYDHANADGFSSSRFTISVGATTHYGTASNYSEDGASVFINAPSNGGSPNSAGITTTDLMGSAGYNTSGDCTGTFGGTSSAAPLVAGVVALMLDANPNLTYRDVMHILAETAVKNDPAHPGWQVNGAGRDVHHRYGFGRVDAGAAVTMAQTWNTVQPEIAIISDPVSVFQNVPDNSPGAGINGTPLTSSVTITDNIRIEHVELALASDAQRRGDTVIELVSPSGHVSQMMTWRPNDNAMQGYNYLFTSVQHWGESSAGEWTLRVYDAENGAIITVNEWQIGVYGTPITANPPNATPATAFNLGDEAARPLLVTNQPLAMDAPDNSDPTPSCGAVTGSVWYRFSASTGNPLRLVAETSIPATVALFRDNGGALIEEDCISGTYDTLHVTPSAGSTYYVMMSAHDPLMIGALSLYLADPLPVGADVYVVNHATSGGQCAAGGACTLADAISTANSTAGQQTIVFDLPHIGATTVHYAAGYTVTDSVNIDGTTQAGYIDQPRVELRGSGSNNGLYVSGGTLTLRGMAVGGYDSGVVLTPLSTGNHSVTENYFGVGVDGVTARPNAAHSVIMQQTATVSSNIIAHSGQSGIYVTAGAGSQVMNNVIGSDISGSAAGNSSGVMVANSSGTVIDNNDIAYNDIGIGIIDGSNAQITNNDIHHNDSVGISISGGTNILIGTLNGGAAGTCAAGCNAIYSNGTEGIRTHTATVQIAGNFVGVTSGGTAAPNGDISHAQIYAGDNTTIGGDTPAAGNFISGGLWHGLYATGSGISIQHNVISGNDGAGLYITAAAGLTAQSNLIGLASDGTSPLPNGAHGVHLQDAGAVLLGGVNVGQQNVIAHNNGSGIHVTGTAGGNFAANHIYANSQLGIDVGGDGVTVPDVIFTGATFEAGETRIGAALSGAPETAYNVAAYFNASCDASGYGEGQQFAISDEIQTDATGAADVTLVAAAAPADRRIITLTVTDENGVTSEFSGCSLDAPSGFNAAAQSQSVIDLTWAGSQPNNVTDIQIDRAINGGEFTPLVTLPPDATAHTVSGLDCGIDYAFRIQYVVNGERFSAYATANALTDSCPPNDDFAAAQTINTLPFSTTQPMSGATSEAGDPALTCADDTTRNVWYAFTPAQSGTYWIETGGSSFDTALIVLDDTLTPVACDNDSGPGTSEFVAIPLTGGETVYIFVGGVTGAGGTLQLSVQAEVQPTATPTPTDTPTPSPTPQPVENTVGLVGGGVWHFRDANSSGTLDLQVSFGSAGQNWLPVVGDWNGDGVDGIGLYRDGVWLFRQTTSSGSLDFSAQFGASESGWQPVAGDWDGDGIDGIGLYRDGVWHLRQMPSSGAPDAVLAFNPYNGSGAPVAGDWNGDGIDTVGLYHNGMWSLTGGHSPAAAAYVFSFGLAQSGWQPVAGDWNSDGVDTIGLYRDGVWRLRNANSSGAVDAGFHFAAPGLPVANYRGGMSGLSRLSSPAPTNTPTLAASATVAPTQSPTHTATQSPTDTPTVTPSATSTPEEATATLTPTASFTSTSTPTYTPTHTATAAPTNTPTPTATASQPPA